MSGGADLMETGGFGDTSTVQDPGASQRMLMNVELCTAWCVACLLDQQA